MASDAESLAYLISHGGAVSPSGMHCTLAMSVCRNSSAISALSFAAMISCSRFRVWPRGSTRLRWVAGTRYEPPMNKPTVDGVIR